jgi:geranylgeranyl diphosphate synthase type II
VTTTSAVDVTPALRRYADLADDEMQRLLPVDGSLEYLVAPVRDYPERPGKGIRPALCLATCEAFGGVAADALPSAGALELLHNAFLIHDDVEDHSDMRRGGPALHRRYGMELAVNAGDALALAAMGGPRHNVGRLGPRLAGRVFDEFDFMARHTVDGQATDIGWRLDNRLDLTPVDYLHLIMRKTCWYTTILPLRLGALIGSAGTADLDPMIDFGFHLGAAFQIRDDILNLTGDTGRYGKEPLGDVREGKRTLILVHLLTAVEGAEQEWLAGFLGSQREARAADDVEKVFELMRRHGSIAFAGAMARGIAHAARETFDVAFAGVPESAARRFVAAMIPYMVERPS